MANYGNPIPTPSIDPPEMLIVDIVRIRQLVLEGRMRLPFSLEWLDGRLAAYESGIRDSLAALERSQQQLLGQRDGVSRVAD